MLTIVECETYHLTAIKPPMPPTALGLISAYLKHGPAFAGILPSGEILAAAGISIQYPGVGDAWAAPSGLVSEYPLLYARTIRRFFAKIVKEHSLRRVQTVVDPRYPSFLRWIDWLGFEVEGIMRRASFDGTDLFLYAKVSENSHGH